MRNHFSFFLIKLLFIITNINSVINDCPNKDRPILDTESNSCVLKYCSEEDFSKNNCIIDNEIVATQWLNKIIDFGIVNCRYTKSASYSNYDIIFFSSYQNISYFYGLKENGRALFSENGNETYNYSLERNYDNSANYGEGEILVIKMGTDNKEYLLNVGIGRGTKSTELYDFVNKRIYYKSTSLAFDSYIIISIRGSLFNLEDSNKFIFGCSTFYSLREYYLIIFKLFLDKKEILESETTLIDSISYLKYKVNGNSVSCFYFDKKYVYLYISSLTDQKFRIVCLDENMNNLITFFNFYTLYMNENVFFKCLHLEADQGLFFFLIIFLGKAHIH